MPPIACRRLPQACCAGWMRCLVGRAAQREAANTAAFILAQRYAATQLGALEAAEAGRPAAAGGHLQRAVTLERSATLDWRPLFVSGAPQGAAQACMRACACVADSPAARL